MLLGSLIEKGKAVVTRCCAECNLQAQLTANLHLRGFKCHLCVERTSTRPLAAALPLKLPDFCWNAPHFPSDPAAMQLQLRDDTKYARYRSCLSPGLPQSTAVK